MPRDNERSLRIPCPKEIGSAIQSNKILSVVLRHEALAKAPPLARGARRIKSLTFAAFGFTMRYAPYVVMAIVVIGVGAWVCWQWMRSQPAPLGPASTSFRMPIDDAFALKIPGNVVVVGKIAEGEVRPGDRLKIKQGNDEIAVEVEALEAFGSPVSVGRSGSNIGVMLVGASKEQIASGATLVR